MQKVVGSNPISRFQGSPALAGLDEELRELVEEPAREEMGSTMHSSRVVGVSIKAFSVGTLALLASVLALLAGASVWVSRSSAEVAEVGWGPQVKAGFLPDKLPRSRMAPASLSIGFTTPLGPGTVPELSAIVFEISRIVTFQTTGLPSCPLVKLYSTTITARRACKGSLVGHGNVISEVTLPGQAPATMNGDLQAFYDFAQGHPRILAQVTGEGAVPLTYVIPFKIEKTHGVFGTSLVAPQMSHLQGICQIGHPNCFADPYALTGVYSHISSFELSLHRLFAHDGKKESFVSAECPAPRGFLNASFSLVKLNLSYPNGAVLSSKAVRQCKVSG